ncbi:AAA family ATPase [Paraburkholderia tropica]|uniref:AAA family ATPase n=1 Tax=Paraburkholderia tropica TaxID=92647 RepID=UPI003015A6DE
MPIALREKYNEHDVEYLKKNKDSFRSLNNKLLSKQEGNNVTATTGTINSVVVHGDTYDKESVSAGEDNVGQILQAIFSFRKLKDEYPNYHGGILLIDEADAGLFPAAQLEFIDILSREAKSLNLQIILTSHSPTMIERVHSLSQLDTPNYRTIYLTDTFGDISVKENSSWPEIYADLHVETIRASEELKLPRVNVYFEDKEGCDLFSAIITAQKLKKPILTQKDITLGCENYKQLISKKIKEFSQKSIIAFDADVEGVDSFRNCVKLPGGVPPDQFLFSHLYNLSAADEYWKNHQGFTRPVFIRAAADIIACLKIGNCPAGELDLGSVIKEMRINGSAEKGKIRTLFKALYQSEDIQKIIHGPVKYNPFRHWAAANADDVEAFKVAYVEALRYCLIVGQRSEAAKIAVFLNGTAQQKN